MNPIKITLGRTHNPAPCSINDAGGGIEISTSNFQLEADRSPELDLFHVEPGADGSPATVMLVFGYLVFKGRLCSTPEAASEFLREWTVDGLSSLDRVDGSFLIVIHEVGTGKTSLVSDPCGARPVWFAETGESICIGSDPREVARRAGLPVEPDPAWLWAMIHFRRTVGQRSSIKGIHGLPAGSVFTFAEGRAATETWFDFTFRPEEARRPAEFGEELLGLVRTAITQTCTHSGRPGLLLSGGLDSRLLAANCPSNVQCITLCDSINREVVLAQKVAKTLGLSHSVVVRPANWYPDLLEASCDTGAGVWLWDQAHFLPLGTDGRDFGHDVAMLGYGSDTFFKGKDIDWPPLWRAEYSTYGKEELFAAFMDILLSQPARIQSGDRMLHPDYAAHCKAEFVAESRRELGEIQNYCSSMPDLWQYFWSRNLSRATALMNLISLRGFTKERNVFTSVSMRRFYLTLPAELRRSGTLPLLALRAGGFDPLLRIPDANTWLPYTYPQSLHKLSAACRRTIARTRKAIRARSKGANYKSNCSWPHNGRLWLHSEKMSDLMDSLIGGNAFDDGRFNRDFVEQSWNEHMNGTADFSGVLDFLATFGCVFRQSTGQDR